MSGYGDRSRFVLDLPNSEAALSLAGEAESTLHSLERLTGATLVMRGLQIIISGRSSQIERAAAVVELIRPIWADGQAISSVDIQSAIGSLNSGQSDLHASMAEQVIVRSQDGTLLRPRTLRQKKYFDEMSDNALTFAIGPAGTGKTFLATVLAVRMLTEKKIEKIILTRPAVEAGERLGFLPGDLQQKIDPYLRPLYDALHLLLGPEKTSVFLEKGLIEVAPLAYMRGRTLSDAFVILDEAQNTTPAQMRMFLTRLGQRSRMVVTGDITQVDLPSGQLSGLVEASEVLAGVEGVSVCTLTSSDVVRHPLVQRLVEAYAHRDEGKAVRRSINR